MSVCIYSGIECGRMAKKNACRGCEFQIANDITMLEHQIRDLITEHIESSGASRREVILTAHHIIVRLAKECQKEEKRGCSG